MVESSTIVTTLACDLVFDPCKLFGGQLKHGDACFRVVANDLLLFIILWKRTVSDR
jgi:hypothetical protein